MLQSANVASGVIQRQPEKPGIRYRGIFSEQQAMEHPGSSLTQAVQKMWEFSTIMGRDGTWHEHRDHVVKCQGESVHFTTLSWRRRPRPCLLPPSAKYPSQFADLLQTPVLHLLAQIPMMFDSNCLHCHAISPTIEVQIVAHLAALARAGHRRGVHTKPPIPATRKTTNPLMNS
jgi:hypothetical protein